MHDPVTTWRPEHIGPGPFERAHPWYARIISLTGPTTPGHRVSRQGRTPIFVLAQGYANELVCFDETRQVAASFAGVDASSTQSFSVRKGELSAKRSRSGLFALGSSAASISRRNAAATPPSTAAIPLSRRPASFKPMPHFVGGAIQPCINLRTRNVPWALWPAG